MGCFCAFSVLERGLAGLLGTSGHISLFRIQSLVNKRVMCLTCGQRRGTLEPSWHVKPQQISNQNRAGVRGGGGSEGGRARTPERERATPPGEGVR